MKKIIMTKNQLFSLGETSKLQIMTGFQQKVNCQIDFLAISFDETDKGSFFAKEKILQENQEIKKIEIDLSKLEPFVKRIVIIDEIYTIQNDKLSKRESPYFKILNDEYEWIFKVPEKIGCHKVFIGFEIYISNNKWYLKAVGNSVRLKLFKKFKASYLHD